MDSSFLQAIIDYCTAIDPLELGGLIFGLLAVIFLIKEHILAWPFGIAYVLLSFVIFWKFQLYGDFLLHIIFLILNIYGWYSWALASSRSEGKIPILQLTSREAIIALFLSIVGIYLFAQFLIYIPNMIEGVPPSSLPYWDSTTSILSVTGMWLTAKKYIDNWYYWLVVDILATGIYAYKEIHFYSLLYFVYIGLAIMGYLQWRKTLALQVSISK